MLFWSSHSFAQTELRKPITPYAELQITKKQIDALPQDFLPHYTTFLYALDSTWKDVPIPSAVAGLFEQETCYNLKHSKCWNVKAELKTDREYGFGLGQLTVTSKFNAWEESKALDSRLKAWKWEDRYNSEYQMIAGVAMLKRNYNIFKYAINPYERFAFSTASYNGGIGGIQADQRVCRNTKGCNEWAWFGNVENTSLKAKTALKGYGKSFYEINREHTRNILTVRRQKYKPFVDVYFDKVLY